MFDFLVPKTKLKAFDIFERNIEDFQVFGISQINPYCNIPLEDEIFVTMVNISNDSKDYSQKEGFVLTKFFSLKKCPECSKKALIPVELNLNFYPNYLRNEERFASPEFLSSRHNFPSQVRAYCNHCNSCFEAFVENKDSWVLEAKKLKEKDLIEGAWRTYLLD